MEKKPLLGGYPLVLLDVVRFATARAAATLSGVVALVAATSGARVATSGARAAARSAAAVVTARLSAVVTARSVTAVTFLGHFTAKGSNLTHLAISKARTCLMR